MDVISNTSEKRIIFYDGDCGFCNSSVQFILNHRKKTFYFAPLQSDFAKEKIEREAGERIEMNTLYFLDRGKFYQKSTAVLRISRGLKGGYPILFYVGIIFPRFFRDWIYDFVAQRRHKIQPGFCAMPTEEDRKLFLG